MREREVFDLLNNSSRPPISSDQFNPSMASSTHSIEGVFIVFPSNIPEISFFLLAILKTLGMGHGG